MWVWVWACACVRARACVCFAAWWMRAKPPHRCSLVFDVPFSQAGQGVTLPLCSPAVYSKMSPNPLRILGNGLVLLHLCEPLLGKKKYIYISGISIKLESKRNTSKFIFCQWKAKTRPGRASFQWGRPSAFKTLKILNIFLSRHCEFTWFCLTWVLYCFT